MEKDEAPKKSVFLTAYIPSESPAKTPPQGSLPWAAETDSKISLTNIIPSMSKISAPVSCTLQSSCPSCQNPQSHEPEICSNKPGCPGPNQPFSLNAGLPSNSSSSDDHNLHHPVVQPNSELDPQDSYFCPPSLHLGGEVSPPPQRFDEIPPIPIPERGLVSPPEMIKASPDAPGPSQCLFPQLLPQTTPALGPTFIPIAYFPFITSAIGGSSSAEHFLPADAVFSLQMTSSFPSFNIPSRFMYDPRMGSMAMYAPQMEPYTAQSIKSGTGYFGPPPMPQAVQPSWEPMSYCPDVSAPPCTAHVPAPSAQRSPAHSSKPRKISLVPMTQAALDEAQSAAKSGSTGCTESNEKRTPTKAPFIVIKPASDPVEDAEGRKTADSPKGSAKNRLNPTPCTTPTRQNKK